MIFVACQQRSERWVAKAATLAIVLSGILSVVEAHAERSRPESWHELMVDGERIGVTRFDDRSRDFTFKLPAPRANAPQPRVQVQDDLLAWQVKVRGPGDSPVFCGRSFSRYTLADPHQVVPTSLATDISRYDPRRILIRPNLAVACSAQLKMCAFLGAHRGYSFSFRLPVSDACRFPEYQRRSVKIIDAWISYLND